MVSSRSEGKIFLAQIRHCPLRELLVAQIPPHDLRIEKRNLSRLLVPSFLWTILPLVTERRDLQPLIVVHRGPPPRRRPSKERHVDLILPRPLKLPKIGLGEEIPRVPVELGRPRLSILAMAKCLRKHETAGGLPILRGGPREVREAIGAGGVKADDGGVGLETVFGSQVDILLGETVIFVEDEAVGFDGNPPGDVDLELGVIALVDEELAVGHVARAAGLAEKVAEGGEEMVPPVLGVPSPLRDLVADDVAVGPPHGHIVLVHFPAIEFLFLLVVRGQGAVGGVDLQGPVPGVPILETIHEGSEDPQLSVLDHHEDATFHVMVQIFERVHRRRGIGAPVKRHVQPFADLVHDFGRLRRFVHVRMLPKIRRGRGLPRFLPNGREGGENPLLQLGPSDAHGEDVHQLEHTMPVRSGIRSAVLGAPFHHELLALGLGVEARHAVGEVVFVQGRDPLLRVVKFFAVREIVAVAGDDVAVVPVEVAAHVTGLSAAAVQAAELGRFLRRPVVLPIVVPVVVAIVAPVVTSIVVAIIISIVAVIAPIVVSTVVPIMIASHYAPRYLQISIKTCRVVIPGTHVLTSRVVELASNWRQ
mmetsp:Transcript_66/g.165  ORF Transcript_66/g.165 Transcript_66/m.165 type:complete len:590 (+) Transcript_66:845-2614(+)